MSKTISKFPIDGIEDRATTDSLLSVIEKNVTPSVNIRFVRVIFNMASQSDDKTNDAYINRLSGLIKNCNYDQLESDLLLDKIICSLKDLHLRENLWLDRDITLTRAIEKCSAKELTQRQMKELSIDKNDFIRL